MITFADGFRETSEKLVSCSGLKLDTRARVPRLKTLVMLNASRVAAITGHQSGKLVLYQALGVGGNWPHVRRGNV